MGSPSRSDVHVNAPLSNLSIVLVNPAFVGTALYPLFNVNKESDIYYTYKDRESLRRASSKRAAGDESRSDDFKPSTETFTCLEYAWKHKIPKRIENVADAPVRVRENAVRHTMERISIDYEADIIEEVTQNAGLTSATPTIKWDATTGTIVIESDIDTGKQAIENAGGGIANTILFNTLVKDAIKKDSTVRDLIRYTIQGNGGQQLLVSGELPPVLWSLKVNVAGAVENTAKVGQTDSISKLWPNSAIIAFVDPSPGLESRSLGLTFSVRNQGMKNANIRGDSIVKTWFEDKTNSTFYETSFIRVPKTVATQCGYNLHSVLT